SDSIAPDGVESILVGQVVADEDRQHLFGALYLVPDPRQGRALIPINCGSKLNYLAAVGDSQVLPPPDAVSAGDDLADVGCRDVAVVHGDGETLVFHPSSADVSKLLTQLRSGLLKHRHRRRSVVVLPVAAVGCDRLEAVAARVPQAGHRNA